MPRKVKNPHDIYAKRIFRKLSLAADFFRHYLPSDVAELLDFSQLAADEGAFADRRLQQHFSDLLFRVPLKTGGTGFLKLLLEHKSAPPPRVAVQLFRYMGHIWSNIPDTEDLPLIIPIVLYHGREAWHIPQEFTALFQASPALETVRRFVPAFSFHLCDLAAYNDGALLGSDELQTKLLMLKHIFGQDFIERFPHLLHEMMRHTPLDELNEELETAIWYAQYGSGATQAQTGQAFISALGGLGDKDMQTIVDKWRQEGRLEGFLQGRQEGRQEGLQQGVEQGRQQGVQQGMQQGMQQGVQQGMQQMTLSLLQKKFGVLDKNLEKRVAALSVPQLTELGLAVLDFQQPDDLAAWLKKQPATRARKKN